jgi:hypothetical protein
MAVMPVVASTDGSCNGLPDFHQGAPALSVHGTSRPLLVMPGRVHGGHAMQYGLRDIGPKVPARTDFCL